MSIKSTPTPSDLGGYQSVYAGTVCQGDLLIPRYSMGPGDWSFAYAEIGCLIIDGYLAGGSYRVYRKMPVAHQSDSHEEAVEAPAEHDKAKTDDANKPPLANLPPAGIEAVARVQAYGHKKYHDFNNYRKGMEHSRQISCAMRHLMKHMDGESIDPESGELHLAHAACRILFLLQNIHDGVAIDDRYKRPTTST